MRLLAVADLHYSLPQFDWVLEVAPDFDVVVLAGDLLELSSIVDRRAQAVVIRKYFERLRAVTRLVICSGNHDLDSPHEVGREGRQMARGFSRRRYHHRWRVHSARRGPHHRLPMVGRADHTGRHRSATRRSGQDRTETVDLDPSRAAGQIADQLGRDALFRRHRARAMDRRVQARHRALGPRASIALRQGRLVGRPHRADLGVQCRSAIRRATDAYHHRHRGRRSFVVLLRRQSVHPLQRAARAAGAAARRDSRLAQSRGSASASGPDVNSSCCWWISVSSTSPTMPR